MRLSTLALVVYVPLLGACERPNLGDDSDTSADTSDTGDTADTSDTSDTADSDTDTGNPDTADTDTGSVDTADTDTGTDTGFGWDPLYLYPASSSCISTPDNQRGVVPKADGAWAAGRFPADSVNPMTVYQVRVVLRHGIDSQSVHCDSSGAFEMRLVVTDTAASPDGSTSPTTLRTHTFDATTLGAVSHRDLVYTLETPLVVPNTDNLWVMVDGNVPGSGDPSCWQTCKEGGFVDQENQNFFTAQANPTDWVWQGLQDYSGLTDAAKQEFMMTVWYTE